MKKGMLIVLVATLPIYGCTFNPPYVSFSEACNALETSEMRTSVVHNDRNDSGQIVLSSVEGRKTPMMTTVIVQTPHDESGVNGVCFEVWDQDGFFRGGDDHIADAGVPMRRGETASPQFAAFSLTCNADQEVVGISDSPIGESSRVRSTNEKIAELYFRRGGYRSGNFKVRCPDLTFSE